MTSKGKDYAITIAFIINIYLFVIQKKVPPGWMLSQPESEKHVSLVVSLMHTANNAEVDNKEVTSPWTKCAGLYAITKTSGYGYP